MLLGSFDLGEFCGATKEVLTYVGWALTIVKVAIPLIIIAYGIMDLGKAVTASKEEETKAAAKRLLYRAIAGVAIFFVPSIILWLFGTIGDFEKASDGWSTCKSAILTPWDVD